MAELGKELVPEHECYICLEQCTTKSPCNCNVYVHKKCLDMWLQVMPNGPHNHCTQCLAMITLTVDAKKHRKRYWCCHC